MGNFRRGAKRICGFLIVSLASGSSLVLADTRISGQVQSERRPAAGAGLVFSCDSEQYPVTADNYGAFQVSLPSAHKSCTLEVSWDNRDSEQFPIDVSSGPRVLSINLRNWNDRWLLDVR